MRKIFALVIILAWACVAYGECVSAHNDDAIFWDEHVVEKGETILKISIVYGGVRGLTIQDIVRANDLHDPENLHENQLLLIPFSADYIEDTRDEVLRRKLIIAVQNEL